MKILWKKTYCTGIKEIDEQHKKFVALTNSLYSEIEEENNDKIINNLIIELKKYAVYHFESEEKLFEKIIYPLDEIELHITEHKRFIEKLDTLYTDSSVSRTIVAYRLAEFLRKWLIDHILSADMKYVSYITDSKLSN